MFFKRKNKNEFEKNSKKYVTQKFHFLIDRGYTLKYYYRNGDELFSYSNEICDIELISELNYIDVCVRYEKSIISYNIRDILPFEINDISILAPIQAVDYFSIIIFRHIDEIESYKEKC